MRNKRRRAGKKFIGMGRAAGAAVRIDLRPPPYQGGALPLSYGSVRPAKGAQITAGNGAILAIQGQAAQGRAAGQRNRAKCSFAAALVFWRSASFSSTFLIRSGAKSCWASAMPRSKDSA